MTRDEYLKTAVRLIQAHWPQWKPNADTIRAGESLLLDLDAREVSAAIHHLAVTAPDFPPGLGKVRATVVELFEAKLPDKDEAWTEVLAEISRVGYMGSPQWSHPAIGQAIRVFGSWQDLCASTTQMADRAHFLRTYEAMQHRAQQASLAPPAVYEVLGNILPELPASEAS